MKGSLEHPLLGNECDGCQRCSRKEMPFSLLVIIDLAVLSHVFFFKSPDLDEETYGVFVTSCIKLKE